MMQRIKTTEANKQVVYTLTRNKYQFKDDRIIAQIAIAFSLQRNKRFNIEKDYGLKDNKGKEYPDSLLGEINGFSNDVVFKAVLNQHYNKCLSNEAFSKLIKLHLDDGLEVFQNDLLHSAKGRNTHIDYLLNMINTGLNLMSQPHILRPKQTRNDDAFEDLLEIELGVDANTKEKVILKINDEHEFDSQHFAFAGMNGSGKTQLVKDILVQIGEQSDFQLKYIFLDYKGEGKTESLKDFLDLTQCEFVDIQTAPLKFNPLIAISLTNERDRNNLIKTFRDKIAAIDKRIGVKQKNNLEISIQRAFEKTIKDGRHPSLVEVYNELEAFYEESNLKPDTLTVTLKDLADVVFDNDFDPDFKLIDRNLYINLPPTLPESARKASVFLLLNYILNYYIASSDVKPSKNRIKPIRYVVVIDEAHAYLKEKNMAVVLEELLRMIRSKGVIIMLLSQGIEEYKQKDFDFSSQIKLPILLNVQNKDIKLAKTFLGTPRSEVPMKNALRKLEKGKGIINFEETKLLEINQFWKRNK